VEEDLLAKVQRLYVGNEYSKTCRTWFWKKGNTSEKTQAVQKLGHGFLLPLRRTIVQLFRTVFYYHVKKMHEQK
jgi:hypothetical protein